MPQTQQLEELKDQVEVARTQIEQLEGEVNTNAALEDDGEGVTGSAVG